MEISKKNKHEVTRYLLGIGDAEEQVAMEERYLSDQEFFEQIVAVEKELLDNYARNRLSSHERELFERHYMAHPKRRARAMTASALVSTLDRLQPPEVETETSPWLRNLFAGLRWQKLAFVMTAISLLLALGCAWLLFDMQRLRTELVQSRTTQNTDEERVRKLNGLRTAQQDRNNQLADPKNLPAAQQQSDIPSQLSFVTLPLIAGQVRDGNQADTPRLVIPAGIKEVRLELKINEGGYLRYRISLQTADGRSLRTLQNLQPGAENTFTIRFPSRLLISGEYVLALSGIDENGGSDSLSKTLFRVESKVRTARK